MGFWGKLGKGLLKIAPYAAMAIPGVGVPLGMAIQGGLSAAQAKAGGAGWKQALLQGGIGAATSAAGAKIPIGPSASGASKFLGGVAGKAGSKGWQSTLGNIAGTFGKNIAGGAMQGGGGQYGQYGGTPPYISEEGAFGGNQGGRGGWADTIGRMTQGIGTRYGGGQAQGQEQYGGGQESGGMDVNTARPRFGAMPEEGWDWQDQPMAQYNQNMPNLATTMNQARADAKRRYVPFQFSEEAGG